MSKNVWFFHHWAIRNWNLPWHVLKGNQTIVPAHQKVRFSHQTKWSFAIGTWNCPSKNNADFPQNLPRSSASVLMPLWQHLRRLRPVRCSRLAVMGRSWWVELGWIQEFQQIVNCQDSKDHGILLGFLFGPEWIDMELYVCTWAYALFLHDLDMLRHDFWWLGMVSNGSLSVNICLCILDASGITFTGELCRNPWLPQMNPHECDKRSIANSCVGQRRFWSRQKKGSTLGRSYQSWRPVAVQMCIPWSGGEGQWKSQILKLPLMMTKMLNHVRDVWM